MEGFNPMLDGLEEVEDIKVTKKPLDEVFIDPFAPKGPYPGLVEIPICIRCNLAHPDTSLYLCPCGKVLCSSQTQYRYKNNDSSMVDKVPYVDQAVEYTISSCCKARVGRLN